MRDLEQRVHLRQNTSGLEVQERGLPNQALQSHGTGNGGKGLLSSLGSFTSVSNVTSNRDNGNEHQEKYLLTRSYRQLHRAM